MFKRTIARVGSIAAVIVHWLGSIIASSEIEFGPVRARGLAAILIALMLTVPALAGA